MERVVANGQYKDGQLPATLGPTVGGNDTETFTRHCDPIMHHKRILNTPSDLPQASDGSITKKHKSGPICILMLNFCFPLRAVRTIIFPRMTLPW